MKLFDRFGNLIGELVPDTGGGCLETIGGFVILIIVGKLFFSWVISEIKHLFGSIPISLYIIIIAFVVLFFIIFIIRKITKINFLAIFIIFSLLLGVFYIGICGYCKILSSKVDSMTIEERENIVTQLYPFRLIGSVDRLLDRSELSGTIKYQYLVAKEMYYKGAYLNCIYAFCDIGDYSDSAYYMEKAVLHYLSGTWKRYPVLNDAEKEYYRTYFATSNPDVGCLKLKNDELYFSTGSSSGHYTVIGSDCYIMNGILYCEITAKLNYSSKLCSIVICDLEENKFMDIDSSTYKKGT